MKEYKPVEIPNGSFNFCKYTISLMLWCSLVLQSKVIVLTCFVILVFSALIKVKNAPLVFLYTNTFDRFFKSKSIILDENAVWFAHTVGAVFSGAALVFLYFINPIIGWVITGILAVLKTSGALGFCGAMKLYGCLNNPNGQCCRVGKKIKNCNVSKE
ncbi:DUF4395 family protein [Acetivibrio cellulolyticus]|uniref:DUF4395 family protein n=1 Tax=Acetivibrio cellulolyticus TaxID=35830 RepID=UPI0001E2EC03|nr:DUF4395 family protein [Acetivibrio cellulolyticus]